MAFRKIFCNITLIIKKKFMKKNKIIKTLLIPTIGITTIGTIAAVSTSCSSVVIVTGVSLNKSSLALEVGKTEVLTATIHPDNATDKSLTWISSDSSVASVDNNGKVTAVGEGSAKVTVKTNDGVFEDYCDVTVTYTAASYICITANADSTLELRNERENNPNLQYSSNGKNWTTYSEKINIPANGKIYLKGNNPNGWSESDQIYSRFNITGNASISGNVMGLLDNGTGETLSIPNDYCFNGLFNGSEGITSVSEDFLPATKLAMHCYAHMFEKCTSLTTTPALPATTLAKFCYYNMFSNCTSITTAPELPATELVTTCYSSMFSNCTSLTIAPELPATTLATYCYWYMFKGCTSLTTAPALLVTQLVEGCYANMFISCQSLTTAPELPATALAKFCYSEMFRDCTNLRNAPELPATALVENCYEYMFENCTLLNSVRINYAGTVAEAPSGAFNNWVDGVNTTGTFYYKGSDTLENFGLPSGWTINPN